MAQKLIKTAPPKVKWIDVDDQSPKHEGIISLFGLVNEGSPHECFAMFHGKYNRESGRFFDLHGDVINNRVTHFLMAE